LVGGPNPPIATIIVLTNIRFVFVYQKSSINEMGVLTTIFFGFTLVSM